MALYEMRTYTLYVGKMAEAVKLYQELGYPALQKGGHDKKLIGYFQGDTCLCRARHRHVYAEHQTMPSQALRWHIHREIRGNPFGIVRGSCRALQDINHIIRGYDTKRLSLQGRHSLRRPSKRCRSSTLSRHAIRGQTMPSDVHTNP